MSIPRRNAKLCPERLEIQTVSGPSMKSTPRKSVSALLKKIPENPRVHQSLQFGQTSRPFRIGIRLPGSYQCFPPPLLKNVAKIQHVDLANHVLCGTLQARHCKTSIPPRVMPPYQLDPTRTPIAWRSRASRPFYLISHQKQTTLLAL